MTRRLFLLALVATVVSLAAPASSQPAAQPNTCSACNTDFDGDGDTDDADVAIFKQAMGAREGDANFNPACDCNDDGVVGGPDWACVLEAVGAH